MLVANPDGDPLLAMRNAVALHPPETFAWSKIMSDAIEEIEWLRDQVRQLELLVIPEKEKAA